MKNLEQIHRVKRGGHLSDHSWEKVSEILDAHFVGYLSSEREGIPVVLPTAYGRIGKKIYIHGAIKNGMINGILEKGIASMTVSILDGLVLARSAYHHSLNYRSVVVTGKVEVISDPEEKVIALKAISDQMLKGRWEEVREPSENELKATFILAFEAEYFVSKSRAGMPSDEKEDYELPIWAGVLPISESYQHAITDEGVESPIPKSVQHMELKNCR
ncbi:pyridoxamine 5'-phosphate oxidase family protein [Sediminitomix flava]|uniref:Nitroimidazol reductase NimA-like FMN-containing flavoprotein (Pyridoxamine 5'-phosphate oxidase superfamily) n=1 Tax=Sediminitomix flava TaxID=379075 RepID=A0A315YVU6_SEDFL|nr:pyridoxamine 5'-phosphate oxidase family protein [Sediminitomix flava]PWJ33658.1 hypothetical protein BC781_1125 [Sediminitomix flava]